MKTRTILASLVVFLAGIAFAAAFVFEIVLAPARHNLRRRKPANIARRFVRDDCDALLRLKTQADADRIARSGRKFRINCVNGQTVRHFGSGDSDANSFGGQQLSILCDI